jgi:hypothetical protein
LARHAKGQDRGGPRRATPQAARRLITPERLAVGDCDQCASRSGTGDGTYNISYDLVFDAAKD